MHRKGKHLLILLAALLVLAAVGPVMLAQTSADFDLSWHVIGGGGGQSTSADYRVHGTIGQYLAPSAQSSSADFHVASGYWYGAAPTPTPPTLHLPLIQQ